MGATIGSGGRSARLTGPGTAARATGPSAARSRRGLVVRVVACVVAVLVVLVAAWAVLAATGAFAITAIECESTEHVDSATIETLANVPAGSTLLTVDTDSIVEGIKKNPWVADVRVVREFPDRLRIVVTERKVGAIVLMGSDSVAWNLGEDGVWIEPLKLEVPDGSSASEVALQKASEEGALLVTDVPSSVTPRAGKSVSSGDAVGDVIEYLDGFSDDFRSQIVSFSAASSESISCTLESGVTVSLGAPSEIADKETVVKAILEKYPDQVTYINVRVPSSPSFRKVDADSVQAGTGATGDAAASTSDAADGGDAS